MYQKPDFIRVKVDIKENFANYGDKCEADIVTKTTMFGNTTTDCNDPMTTRIISEPYDGSFRCYTEYQNV